MRVYGVPTVRELRDVFFDEKSCIEWLIHHEVLSIHEFCPDCGYKMSTVGKQRRCTQKACRKKISLFKGTFFSKSRIACNEIMHIAYLWLTRCTADTIRSHTGHSTNTITDYSSYMRQLVASTLETDDMLIGGDGIVVQIDETKMGKRKYHRGHHVEGAWVLVGVELTSDRKVFAEVVTDRSVGTLASVLHRHIAQGSEMHTDCWKSYPVIAEAFGLSHKTVNHSQGFKDQETGVHTNHVEGTNYALKRAIPPRNRTQSELQPFLLEFVWRRKNEGDWWGAYIEALKVITYDD
jgi:hypothetical protein